MFFLLSPNEKQPKKHKNENKLSKMCVYCSKRSQDIVYTEQN